MGIPCDERGARLSPPRGWNPFTRQLLCSVQHGICSERFLLQFSVESLLLQLLATTHFLTANPQGLFVAQDYK